MAYKGVGVLDVGRWVASAVGRLWGRFDRPLCRRAEVAAGDDVEDRWSSGRGLARLEADISMPIQPFPPLLLCTISWVKSRDRRA